MPVGGSVDEGVAIVCGVPCVTLLSFVMYTEPPRCRYGAWDAGELCACAFDKGLAYKTTRKYHDKVARTTAVESPLICAS